MVPVADLGMVSCRPGEAGQPNDLCVASPYTPMGRFFGFMGPVQLCLEDLVFATKTLITKYD